jgi:hypothetical protein
MKAHIWHCNEAGEKKKSENEIFPLLAFFVFAQEAKVSGAGEINGFSSSFSSSSHSFHSRAAVGARLKAKVSLFAQTRCSNFIYLPASSST